MVGSGNLMHFQDRKLKHIELNKTGIAMTCKTADLLNIREGDFVSWHLTGDDKWFRDRVMQIYRNPSSQGITMTAFLHGAEEADLQAGDGPYEYASR